MASSRYKTDKSSRVSRISRNLDKSASVLLNSAPSAGSSGMHEDPRAQATLVSGDGTEYTRPDDVQRAYVGTGGVVIPKAAPGKAGRQLGNHKLGTPVVAKLKGASTIVKPPSKVLDMKSLPNEVSKEAYAFAEEYTDARPEVFGKLPFQALLQERCAIALRYIESDLAERAKAKNAVDAETTKEAHEVKPKRKASMRVKEEKRAPQKPAKQKITMDYLQRMIADTVATALASQPRPEPVRPKKKKRPIERPAPAPQPATAATAPAAPPATGMASLQIPDLQDAPSKPRYRVEFKIPGFGTTSAWYHWVGIHGKGLFLIYDTRFEYGSVYTPPDTGPEQYMEVVVHNHGTYRCLSTDFIHPFGAFMIINLILENEEPEVRQQRQQPNRERHPLALPLLPDNEEAQYG